LIESIFYRSTMSRINTYVVKVVVMVVLVVVLVVVVCGATAG